MVVDRGGREEDTGRRQVSQTGHDRWDDRMDETPWSELFPDGRVIIYEGDDPEEFTRQVEAEFGFDPGSDERWDWDNPDAYWFHCPAEHLDAIYGSSRWPMGS